jgi:uncharacterized membrane protein (GlpM family)
VTISAIVARFIIGGGILAIVPIIAHECGNRDAGFLLVFPTLIIIGFVSQYISHGKKATTELVHASLIGVPALVFFMVVCYLLLRCNADLGIAIAAGSVVWFAVVILISTLVRS